MDGIRIYMRTREGTVQETAFEQSGNTCSFSLSGITDRQLFLELVFREVTAVMGLCLKDRFGTACLCLVENGFSAGDAMLSEDRSVRIRVIRPENCDGEVLNGTFTAVEMPGGRELVRSVGERLSKQETQIREKELRFCLRPVDFGRRIRKLSVKSDGAACYRRGNMVQ